MVFFWPKRGNDTDHLFVYRYIEFCKGGPIVGSIEKPRVDPVIDDTNFAIRIFQFVHHIRALRFRDPKVAIGS